MHDAKGRPPQRGREMSLDSYERLLTRARRMGYAFPMVSELRDRLPPRPRILLLRHDIDVSPVCALEMARLEHALGVRSSYFVLLHSPFYHPGAPPHIDALRKIVDLGFEVGLHYDVEFFRRRGIEPLEGIGRDTRALEALLGIRIRSVSQHRPASSEVLRGISRRLVDAYSPHLTRNLHYISDSGFRWRGASLEQELGVRQRIHALIHPATWAWPLDMEETYRRCADQAGRRVRAAFDDFIASTHQYLARRPQLDRLRLERELGPGTQPRSHRRDAPRPPAGP
ncbi:MAG: hypothetical protein Q9Q40_12020 [Acidobacteriota bacterium]|nr:hypothetical protein [Acidobacteriota bacterium]MDQ7088615.1 hypothetical protein [Acidobacteriota bacterium]